MIRNFQMPKTPPIDVARAVLAAMEAGEEDIFPDPMAQQVYDAWRQDPKAVERQFASMSFVRLHGIHVSQRLSRSLHESRGGQRGSTPQRRQGESEQEGERKSRPKGRLLSCPSWDRTRTLLIQSQACCQLHQGAESFAPGHGGTH